MSKFHILVGLFLGLVLINKVMADQSCILVCDQIGTTTYCHNICVDY